MTNTIMNEFKQALHNFKTGENWFTKQQRNRWTLIDSIADRIEHLLDDEKMMEANNALTFEQRTQMAKIGLLADLYQLATEDNNAEFAAQINKLRYAANNCRAIAHEDHIHPRYESKTA